MLPADPSPLPARPPSAARHHCGTCGKPYGEPHARGCEAPLCIHRDRGDRVCGGVLVRAGQLPLRSPFVRCEKCGDLVAVPTAFCRVEAVQ